ncbi:putative efflux pump outer membrane protein TtgC [Paraburkholderia ultramafica]|uniref:Putative efflux pump outer membrane protein TtgC n=1 Tax=Paraburkholderia ultramafica TaxID=1544867 RepID=A0A6S7CVF5_9BURK|nr:efflux transporter outer membrane subunit [Paraburkholderia ultramafica]CAB3789015.1 putative efflux pump outer membrane protein TtgC [Paraburkholderia ultramafica]
MNVPCSLRDGAPRRRRRAFRRVVLCGCAVAAALMTAGCAVGPDYRKPTIDIPTSFKEGVEWQRAQVDPKATLPGKWWLDYHDDTLTHLVQEALKANQSVAQAEAAYRLAQATVAANTAGLFPTISAGISGSRAGAGAGAVAANGGALNSGVHNTVTADAAASWELDLWGQIRREIESSKASAQASDAQLAGQRLSVAASVAADYFGLRRADVDIDLLEQQKRIDAGILDMVRASYAQGESSSDSVLAAQDTLELVIADLQSTQTSREQYEHAIAVLIGVPPGNFSIAPDPHYAFVAPAVPLSLPSQLLERRYDVVSAERTAASANAKIGVAQAAFFPTLTLSAQGGFQHSSLANLFSVPNRFWTLGPELAGTIFDGGARTAAMHEARATYDEAVAAYRQAVLSAFESVEDSLSSWNHLAQQERAFADIYQRNKRLFESEQAQFQFGTASRQNLLSQQLTLLLAQQNLADTQASLALSSVTLIKNLGGGWRWDEANESPADVVASSRSSR